HKIFKKANADFPLDKLFDNIKEGLDQEQPKQAGENEFEPRTSTKEGVKAKDKKFKKKKKKKKARSKQDKMGGTSFSTATELKSKLATGTLEDVKTDPDFEGAKTGGVKSH